MQDKLLQYLELLASQRNIHSLLLGLLVVSMMHGLVLFGTVGDRGTFLFLCQLDDPKTSKQIYNIMKLASLASYSNTHDSNTIE